MKHAAKSAAVVLAVGLAGTGTVWAAYDAFLQIDGIRGESTDPQHRDEIGVVSFSWGVAAAGAVAPRTRSAGRIVHNAFTIVKQVDKASPMLMSACASGRHIPKVIVEARTMTYEMHDVIISSVRAGGAGGEGGTETVVLNYATILMRQIPAAGAQPHVPPGSLAPNKAAVLRHP